MKHNSTPAWSMAQKTPAELMTSDKLTPGAGSYNIRGDPTLSPSQLFSKSRRSDLKKTNNFPGPGAYTIPSFVDSYKPKQSTDQQGRITRDRTDKAKGEAPGPGSYNPITHKKTTSYSLGNKTSSLTVNLDKEIGPGMYTPQTNSVYVSYSVGFTKAKRKTFDLNQSPGPGAYDPGSAKPNSPSYRFNRSNYIKSAGQSYPGPSNYTIPSFTDNPGKGGRSINSAKPVETKNLIVPGPGAYNPKKAFSTSYSIGKSKRQNLYHNKLEIGPGAHDIKYPAHTARASSIGTSQRSSLYSKELTPGPGAYEQKPMAFAGPRHSLTGRHDPPKGRLEVPGPGQHNLNLQAVLPNGPAFGIGSGHRAQQLVKRVPGPGHYYRNPASQGQGWTFGKSPREVFVDNDEPGPGQYDIEATVPDVAKYVKDKFNNSIDR